MTTPSRAQKLQNLRRAIRRGIESGPSTPFDPEEIKREVRNRIAARRSSMKRQPHPDFRLEVLEGDARKRKGSPLTAKEREALHVYFELVSGVPTVRATPAELRAIARGRREVARGNTISLDQVKKELADHDRAQTKKKRR